MTAYAFLIGAITGAALAMILVAITADQHGITDAKIIQMIPAYCGKDGSR